MIFAVPGGPGQLNTGSHAGARGDSSAANAGDSFQMLSLGAHGAPKSPERPPRAPPEGSKRAPGKAPDGPKTSPGGSPESPETGLGAQDAPRGPGRAPRGPQRAPRVGQKGSPEGPIMLSRVALGVRLLY